MGAMSDWRSFWDSTHSIYVNARHKDVHYREIADQIAAFAPNPGARVLDYGCGEAIHADRVAVVASELMLCDQAPSVRAAITARFAADPRIRALAPEEVAALPDRSVDLIVANSMTQYLAPAELDQALALWHRLLAPGGTLIVGDVIPPDAGALTDVQALLGYAAANGFLPGRPVGPRAHRRVALQPAAQPARGDALHAIGLHAEAESGGLWRRAPVAQPGAQCRPHDLPGPPALNARVPKGAFRAPSRAGGS